MEEFEDGFKCGDIRKRGAGFHGMVMDVALVEGYEDVLIALVGGNGKTTC